MRPNACSPVAAALAVVASLSTWASGARADPELDQRNQLDAKVAAAWAKEDFDTLEATENRFLDPAERTGSGKRWLAVFEDALEGAMRIQWPKDWNRVIRTKTSIGEGPSPRYFSEADHRWDAVEQRLRRWSARFPDSPNPVLARAHYHLLRAWFFRGTFRADQVSEEALPIFARNLDAAERLLEQIRAARARNPLWFEALLEIYALRSPPPSLAQRQGLLQDLLENGQGYPPAWSAALYFLEPRWGGSPREIERLARLAGEKTMGEEKGSMYARLYWSFESAYQYGPRFFEDTAADWPTLKASFERLVAAYPSPRSLSAFAMFACIANEAPRAQELLKRAATDSYLASWRPELRRRCPSPNVPQNPAVFTVRSAFLSRNPNELVLALTDLEDACGASKDPDHQPPYHMLLVMLGDLRGKRVAEPSGAMDVPLRPSLDYIRARNQLLRPDGKPRALPPGVWAGTMTHLPAPILDKPPNWPMVVGGTLHFARLEPGRGASGRASFEFEDGGRMEASFDAPWCEPPAGR